MVSQHARAVARSTGVDQPFARPPAKCASASQKALEVCGGEPNSTWICDLSFVGTDSAESQAIWSSNRDMDTAFGTNSDWMGSFVLLDFSCATSTKDWISPCRRWRHGSATCAAWKRQRKKSAR